MRDIIPPSRYFVVFLPTGGCTAPIGEDPSPEAVVIRSAHPLLPHLAHITTLAEADKLAAKLKEI